MSVAQVIRAKCRACSKFRDPREFAGGAVIGVCWSCYEKHLESLRFLAGAPPRGCQECGHTIAELDELSKRAGRADTRLVLERKDGIYQVLCLDCDEQYQTKRRDLYGATPYGMAKGLG